MLMLSWDILALTSPRDTEWAYLGSWLGPFAYINYAPSFDFKDYWLYYGIRYGFGILKNKDDRLPLFTIECGKRIIDNKNGFYLSAGTDLFVILSALLIP
jgi:hypothetical protein